MKPWLPALVHDMHAAFLRAMVVREIKLESQGRGAGPKGEEPDPDGGIPKGEEPDPLGRVQVRFGGEFSLDRRSRSVLLGPFGTSGSCLHQWIVRPVVGQVSVLSQERLVRWLDRIVGPSGALERKDHRIARTVSLSRTTSDKPRESRHNPTGGRSRTRWLWRDSFDLSHCISLAR